MGACSTATSLSVDVRPELKPTADERRAHLSLSPSLFPSSCGCGVLTGPRSAVSAGAVTDGRPADSGCGSSNAHGTAATRCACWAFDTMQRGGGTSYCANKCAAHRAARRCAVTGPLSTGGGRTDLRSSGAGLRREAQERRYRFEPASDSCPGPPVERARGRAFRQVEPPSI